MFSMPRKLLIIAMDSKDEPVWGASMIPHSINQDLDSGAVRISFDGILIDGPMSMADIAKSLDGKL